LDSCEVGERAKTRGDEEGDLEGIFELIQHRLANTE
jgi:hypothetical protein